MNMILFQSILTFSRSLFSSLRTAGEMGRASPVGYVPAVMMCMTSPGKGIPRLDLGGCDCLPIQVPAMNAENGADALASGRHTHEPESSGFVAVAASHHICRLHSTKRLKHLPKIAARDITRQVPYVDIHSVPLSSASTICVGRMCQTTRNDSGDGS